MIIDLDAFKENQLFITESDEVDDSKIRMKPAEFSRLIGVSKQAVSAWIRDGKISIGFDGHLNPNEAISQLLKKSNPAKLRSKALMPLIKQIRALSVMNKQKELDLAELKDEVVFFEQSTEDYSKIIWTIKDRLNAEATTLGKYHTMEVINAFLSWLERYQENLDDNLTIIEFIPGAPVKKKEGVGLMLINSSEIYDE